MLDWIAPALKAAQLGAAAILFGTPAFYVYAKQQPQCWHVKLSLTAIISLLLAAILAMLVQIEMLLGKWPASLGDIWWYLGGTQIGKIVLGRFVVLAGYALVVWLSASSPRYCAETVIGGAILASFAWTGHGAEEGGWHAAAYVTHLLMAGIWVGALVPLLIAIKTAKKRQELASEVSRGLDAFSRIGIAVVTLLIASGIGNAWSAFDTAHWTTVALTEYGMTLLAKIALLLGMLTIAAANRYRLAPALAKTVREAHSPVAALANLHRSLALETGLAILVLGLAAHLGSIEPPGH